MYLRQDITQEFIGDTRDASQANGAPFVAGQLNLDKGWGGYVPAARFSVR